MATSNWARVNLGDHIDLLTGYPFSSAEYTDDPGDVRLLRGDNIVQGQFRWEGVKRWPVSSINELVPYLLEDGDVVLAMDRPWIEAGLKFATVSTYDLPCLLVQRVARLRAKDALDQGFLRYLIGSAQFTHHVLGVQTGTAVPHISAGQIKEYRFLLPSLPEQRAIAHILGILDDKIELNRRMNVTLEAMAQAIFKSWFVDFDPVRAKTEGRQLAGMDAETAALFPDEFEDLQHTKIPHGWLLGTLEQLATLRRETINPSGFPDTPFEHYSLPAFDEGRLPKIERGSDIKSNKFVVRPNQILLSKINPRIPRVWLPSVGKGRTAICSTEFLVLEHALFTPVEYVLELVKSSGFLDTFASLVTGTSSSHQRVRPNDLLSMHIVIPPRPIMRAFAGIMYPIHQQVAANLLESVTLASIRDALLPKLLSGAIRVNEVETLVTAYE